MKSKAVFEAITFIRRYWTLTFGEKLYFKRENYYTQDLYAVAVLRGSIAVGHVLARKILGACALCLRSKRSAVPLFEVGASRTYSLVCIYRA